MNYFIRSNFAQQTIGIAQLAIHTLIQYGFGSHLDYEYTVPCSSTRSLILYSSIVNLCTFLLNPNP